MIDNGSPTERRPIVRRPGEGRVYDMGAVSAIFKADEAETDQMYSISEWWLDAHTKGPGAHTHPDDDVLYVLAGTISVLAGTEWVEADARSFVLIPGGGTHTFDNRTGERAGFLSISAPGGFEQRMPGIARWFIERSPAGSQV